METFLQLPILPNEMKQYILQDGRELRCLEIIKKLRQYLQSRGRRRKRNRCFLAENNRKKGKD